MYQRKWPLIWICSFVLIFECRQSWTASFPNGSISIGGPSSSPRPLRIVATFSTGPPQAATRSQPLRNYDFDDENFSPTPVPEDLFVKIPLKEPVPKETKETTLKPLTRDQAKKTVLITNNHNNTSTSSSSSSRINKELANSRLNYQHHQSPRNITDAQYNAYDVSTLGNSSSKPEILRVLERPRPTTTFAQRARTIVAQSLANDLVNSNPYPFSRQSSSTSTTTTSPTPKFAEVVTRIWKNRRIEGEVAMPHGFMHTPDSLSNLLGKRSDKTQKTAQIDLTGNLSLVISDNSQPEEEVSTEEPEITTTMATEEPEEATTTEIPEETSEAEEPVTEEQITNTERPFKRVTKIGDVKISGTATSTTTTTTEAPTSTWTETSPTATATSTTTTTTTTTKSTTSGETLTEEETGFASTSIRSVTNHSDGGETNEVTKEPTSDSTMSTTGSTKTTTTSTTPAPSTTVSTTTTTFLPPTTTRQPESSTISTTTESLTQRSEQSTGSTTKSPLDRDVPAVGSDGATLLVRIVFQNTWHEVCTKLPEMRKTLAGLVNANTNRNIAPDQVIFRDTQCAENLKEPTSTTSANVDGDDSGNSRRNKSTSTTSGGSTGTTMASSKVWPSVTVYVIEESGIIDVALTKTLPTLYSDNRTSIKYPLQILNFELIEERSENDILFIIEIGAIAVLTFLVLLGGILFVMRKRQTRFNYGERCRPVSLDAYSLDSVSAYNSVRRSKDALRSSKRSYGNPAFEDNSVTPSHPLNFTGLSSFSNDMPAIAEEFSKIPQVYSKIEDLPVGADTKNRYANVIPLPETRVPLEILNNDPQTEYINANYVRGPKNALKYYIACQAPKDNTVADFWRMIWEQQTKVIIMLTDLVENGKEKCTEYIPPSEVSDCHRLYGDYQVTLKKRDTKEKYATSTLQLKNLENNTYREVYHIWYLWPSNATPSDLSALVSVLFEARSLQRGGPGPIVVHCSPGTGRTGTLISLDLAIRQYEHTRTVDVPRVVYTIRRDRAMSVQTKQQYAFIYKALNFYAAKLSGCPIE